MRFRWPFMLVWTHDENVAYREEQRAHERSFLMKLLNEARTDKAKLEEQLAATTTAVLETLKPPPAPAAGEPRSSQRPHHKAPAVDLADVDPDDIQQVFNVVARELPAGRKVSASVVHARVESMRDAIRTAVDLKRHSPMAIVPEVTAPPSVQKMIDEAEALGKMTAAHNAGKVA